MPTINGDNTTTQTITGSGQTWTVVRSATILTTSYGLIEGAGLHDNTIIVSGVVRVEPDLGATAVYSVGSATTIRVSEAGFISGYNAILSYGQEARIFNEGTVSASTTGGNGVGIYADGAGSRVDNDGLVAGNHAVILGAADVSLLNRADGVIIGYVHPVWTETGPGQIITITNHGEIVKAGGGAAITGGAGSERVRNDGLIDGDLLLGAGDDKFDNRGGEVRGFIFGEAGDDTLIAGKATDQLSEAAASGFDTVKASMSYELAVNVEALVLTGRKNTAGTGSADANTIDGNAGDNILRGLAGADHLDGGGGRDKLTGGTEADEFLFHRRGGVDTVMDYDDEEDRIAILDFGNIGNFDRLLRHVSQHGDDVWITLGSGDKLILKDVDEGALEATDFDFAW